MTVQYFRMYDEKIYFTVTSGVSKAELKEIILQESIEKRRVNVSACANF